MPFPDSPRFLYEKKPLVQVICQLRFPALLRINAEAPVAFQESIRKQFPIYREKAGVHLVPQNVLDQLPTDIADAFLNTKHGNAHEFLTKDGHWLLSLTRDFIALSTDKYTRWEKFSSNLKTPRKALEKHYSPSFYSRIGLRYQDVISRSALGLENMEWQELLNPELAGLLANAKLATRIKEIGTQFAIKLDKYDSVVNVRHGFAISQLHNNEQCYLIDADFFTETPTEVEYADELLNYFNQYGRRLFRWFISEQLHNAMVPVAL